MYRFCSMALTLRLNPSQPCTRVGTNSEGKPPRVFVAVAIAPAEVPIDDDHWIDNAYSLRHKSISTVAGRKMLFSFSRFIFSIDRTFPRLSIAITGNLVRCCVVDLEGVRMRTKELGTTGLSSHATAVPEKW